LKNNELISGDFVEVGVAADTSASPSSSVVLTPNRRPSVIFPSVENKPTIINSSFTYDAGRNLNGVTVKRGKQR
jgi:hypothetical protein